MRKTKRVRSVLRALLLPLEKVFDTILIYFDSFLPTSKRASQSENENCQGRRCQIISLFAPLGFYRSHSKQTITAFQVKLEYGKKRFETFLTENVSYDVLASSIKKYCSSLAQIDADKIRLRYRDEDYDMVNVCQADFFCVLGNSS